MKKLAVVGAALALAGCVSGPTATPFVSPDGKTAFGINCSENGMTACYSLAREACGGNYEIMRTVDTDVPWSNPKTGQLYSLSDQRLYVVCATQPS